MARSSGPEGASSAGDPPAVGAHDAVPSESRWERLLDNKTGLQRAVISLGALAAAAIAIGGVVAAVVRIIDDEHEGSRDIEGAPAETIRIESGTNAADEFMRALDERHEGVVILNHQLIAEKGPTDVSLQYNCNDSGVCVMARIQDVDVEATEMNDGLWFAGCFAVTRDGAGYGFEPLDMELRYQGDTCP